MSRKLFAMSMDERLRIRMLKISLYVGLVSLLINKLTMVILLSLYVVGVRRFKPLVKVLDMHTYPIFSTCVSLLGILANSIALYLTSSAIFPHRRAGLVNSMKVAQYFYFFYVITLGTECMVTGYTLENVEYEFEGGMFSSMKKYGTDTDIKVQIDLLQMKYQCCGDKSYKDWFSLQWIRHPYINLDDAIDRNELRLDGRYRTDSVPFSCCNVDILRSCVFEHVNDHGIRINYNSERDHTLYPEGCRKVMIWRIKNLISWLLASYIILGVINLAHLVTFRYLVTSISEALKHGQPVASTVAHL